MQDCTDLGNVTKEFCERTGLNSWSLRMTMDSYIKSPVKYRLRGFIIVVNDLEITIHPHPFLNPEHIRDFRGIGNMTLEQIEYLEVNPIALTMVVKSFMQASPKVREGLKFITHDCIFQIKPFHNRELEKHSR